MKDYYKILEVDKDASEGDIKKSYRKLAKKYHPDKNAGNKEAEGRFKEISEAYAVLSSKEKRQEYDQIRAMGGRGYSSFDPFGNADFQSQRFQFDDLGDLGSVFSSLFGSGGSPFGGGGNPFGGGGGQFRSGGNPFGGMGGMSPKRGEDVQTKVYIPFELAAKGGKHEVTIQKEIGQAPKTYVINIPAGIESGKKIKLAKEGRPGMGGGYPGDLLVEIQVKHHSELERDGMNILSEKKISLRDAMHGTKVLIKTIHGQVEMKIPAGIQPGSKMRIRGQGVHHKGGKGDHFLAVQVALPKIENDTQKEALERFLESIEEKPE